MFVGIDIGSTTTKIVALDPDNKDILFSNYIRHNAHQMESVYDLLCQLNEKFPNTKLNIVFSGSGSKALSEKTQMGYVQEVVANSIALQDIYDTVGTAIELGGQDAKMIFFQGGMNEEPLKVADMRMNGSCAGGTGAFIDEMAAVLNIPVEHFNEYASQGKCVYDISGRCGVYAKTDIQPLVNQGVLKQDLALSSFHAIAKQTIGGLAQGLDIRKPVVFEGGPLTFNPTLIRVFAERLELAEEDILIPEHPQLMVAYGAALAAETMFDGNLISDSVLNLIDLLKRLMNQKDTFNEKDGIPFFKSKQEFDEFKNRHKLPEIFPRKLYPGDHIKAYLGIDSGSTTTKFVLLDENEEIFEYFYASNEGDPLVVAKDALMALRKRYQDAGVTLEILGTCSTGYGEQLFARAFSAECHVVETVAHARGVEKYIKNASFILDIGGQDMKAIWLDNGIITNIIVNEACSSGCGSFLENFASTLHIPVKEIADAAFASENPAYLGSRCTVFMNSSIVSEQRNGKKPNDIMAGLCRSIIENVFTKVIRMDNLNSLGDTIVVQG
ncbi:MAG: activase, partial [Lachnospiraceae bacterium]|nr:activase [Lachnospiraceae bacterium]